MPEIYRALVVVLGIALTVFWFARKPITEAAMAPGDFTRRRNLWLLITLALFVANNFWLFMSFASVALLHAARREKNLLALMVCLVLAVPLIDAPLTAFGLVNYLIDLNFYRLFNLLVLLPAFLALRRQADTMPFGRNPADRFLLGFLLLQFAQLVQGPSLTNALREGLYLFLDVFLTYYVASRYLKNVAGFRDVLATFVLVSLVIGVIGVFEFLKSWLLYSNIAGALDAPWALGRYLGRGESLRALANTGQPLVLGFVLAIGLCLYLYVQESFSSPKMRTLGLVGMAGVLVAPLSRGPWIGALLGYIVFVALGPHAWRSLSKKAVVGLVLFLLALASPFGDAIISHLPFVGTVDAENVTYREDLLSNSIKVISRHPWLGSPNYYQAPELEAMRWGGDDGIIDIVNSYIAIALGYGLLGLGLFVACLLSVLLGVYRAMRSAMEHSADMFLLGRALLAAMVCTVVTIYTVSSISYIPIVYWLLFGLGVAYQSMVRQTSAIPAATAGPQSPGLVLPVRPRPRRPQVRLPGGDASFSHLEMT